MIEFSSYFGVLRTKPSAHCFLFVHCDPSAFPFVQSSHVSVIPFSRSRSVIGLLNRQCVQGDGSNVTGSVDVGLMDVRCVGGVVVWVGVVVSLPLVDRCVVEVVVDVVVEVGFVDSVAVVDVTDSFVVVVGSFVVVVDSFVVVVVDSFVVVVVDIVVVDVDVVDEDPVPYA